MIIHKCCVVRVELLKAPKVHHDPKRQQELERNHCSRSRTIAHVTALKSEILERSLQLLFLIHSFSTLVYLHSDASQPVVNHEGDCVSY